MKKTYNGRQITTEKAENRYTNDNCQKYMRNRRCKCGLGKKIEWARDCWLASDEKWLQLYHGENKFLLTRAIHWAHWEKSSIGYVAPLGYINLILSIFFKWCVRS